MEKIQISYTMLNDCPCVKSKSGGNKIYQLSEDEVLKIFSLNYSMKFHCYSGYSLEEKILNSEKYCCDSAIVSPKKAAYYGDTLVGYTEEKVDGESIFLFYRNVYDSCSDLYPLACLYSKLEEHVRNASDVVFPDLCTLGNVLVSGIDEEMVVKFVDYDGLQVDCYPSMNISSLLGDFNQYKNSKYLSSGKLFTKELDKRSLAQLYFLLAFHIDLNCVGHLHPDCNRPMTSDDLFWMIGLDDEVVQNKIRKFFSTDVASEYLGDDVFRIADQYEVEEISHPYGFPYKAKKLRKK